LIVPGGDVDGTFKPTTGNGGRGGSTKGDGGSSGKIGNNGNGGDGGLILEHSESGSIAPLGAIILGKPFIASIAAGGVVAPIVDLSVDLTDIGLGPLTYLHLYAPSQARTGNGGMAKDGNGGSSGSIGTNGNGGDGGAVILVTDTGKIDIPHGAIVTAGGDGGTAFDQTGNGGRTEDGAGGSSGGIGQNSNGGSAGPVTLNAPSGNISVSSVLILRGAIASNSGDRTGNGGSAKTGRGGASGSIGTLIEGKRYAGGMAGKGGTLKISAGGAITTSEAIVATGGDAGALSPATPLGLRGFYFPVTGNGGNGDNESSGGDSGDIGIAGVAGKGGSVSISTPPPPNSSSGATQNFNLDRVLVNGGNAGTKVPPPPQPPFEHFSVYFPAGDGVQRGITGNGGRAGKGGDAGTVGGGVVGGDGGEITISSGGAITSVEYHADGGSGGGQEGRGGLGGEGIGLNDAGHGGTLDGAGNGGDAGTIKLDAQENITLKQADGIGGSGGATKKGAAAGDGGNGSGAKAGAGGSLGGSGKGGKGGTLVITTAPPVPPETQGATPAFLWWKWWPDGRHRWRRRQRNRISQRHRWRKGRRLRRSRRRRARRVDHRFVSRR
jgi:hypothetical protein